MGATKSVTTAGGEAVKFTVDPRHGFPDYPTRALLQSLGVLPLWALDKSRDETFADSFERNYDFWVGRTDSGKTHITDEGVYQYPEDPDMDPILKIEGKTEIVWFYQYALVAIVNKMDDGVFVTRMD